MNALASTCNSLRNELLLLCLYVYTSTGSRVPCFCKAQMHLSGRVHGWRNLEKTQTKKHQEASGSRILNELIAMRDSEKNRVNNLN